MNRKSGFRKWVLAPGLFMVMGAARAAVGMEGEVTLDYYIADVDPDGYELTEMEFYVERVVNDSANRSGPLSLAGWLTRDTVPGGAGVEAGYLPLGSLPGNSALEVWDTVSADDVLPGEYYVHALLQDDRFPDTFEDSRTLSPRLLWRGGLEAKGPLWIYTYDGGHWLSVEFGELRNRRLDSRYTNDIVLTLYATYGFGPASDGYELCEAVVPGLYAGEARHSMGFDCRAAAIPDGEYTLHLMVAESRGRGGSSTLSGPDAYFRAGHLDHLIGADACCVYADEHIYYSGATGLTLLCPLLLLASLRGRSPFRRRLS
jgi:hypothetical protein